MRILICAFVVFASAACVQKYGPTAYVPEELTGGYGESRVDDHTWSVYVHTNGSTSYETGETYWLYRCSALAIANGFDGFSIIKKWEDLGDHGTKSVEGTIVLLKNPFVPVPRKTFDARNVQSALQIYMAGPKCHGGNICAGDWRKSIASGIFTRLTIFNITDQTIDVSVADDTRSALPWGATSSSVYPQEAENWRLTIEAGKCTYLYDMPHDLNDYPWRADNDNYSVSIPMQFAQDALLHIVPPHPGSSLPERTLTAQDWRPPIVPARTCR